MQKTLFPSICAILACLGLLASAAFAQKPDHRLYGKGHPFQADQLPAGKLKTKLTSLNPRAQERAMKWLHKITFEEFDAAEHLRVDEDGGIFIVCPDSHGNCKDHSEMPTESGATEAGEGGGPMQTQSAGDASADASEPPPVANAPVPVSTPPAYNSKPGAARHIYLDFNGALVSGKAWSVKSGTTTWNSWNCAAWSSDTDVTTFSDDEKADMRRVWERISEDYAPFDVNVTTDVAYDSVNYIGNKNNVGWLLFTSTTDKNGARCPHYGVGGVAYLGVFGDGDFFSAYQPAWVTPASASDMAEAGSHEMGHNMGLSHDGKVNPSSPYYSGHAGTSSAPSWGPIMGTGNLRNVSQWSKGEYSNSSEPQDDLAIISIKAPYRADDHGDTQAASTVWISSPINQAGRVETTGNADYFRFSTAAGSVSFSANPYRCDTSTWGGNLDILLELYDSNQTLVASDNPATLATASISTTVAAGTYYLVLKPAAAGNPLASTPSGYTTYGSLGQYTITGGFVPTDSIALTSPRGGELWGRGQSRNITWSSAMGGNVKIELLRNGIFDSNIATNTPNDGSHSWAIPSGQALGADYRIRVTSVETPARSDTSFANFTILIPPIYYVSMDTNPGWTFSHLGWSWGQPTGEEQDGHGSPDPTSGYNGTNVIGYRLDGDYDASISTTRWATTPSMNCSGRQNVTLSFRRWLGVEQSGFDRAYIQVSNNGTTWTTIWENPNTTIDDTSWANVQYDISAVADGRPTVYVRWGMGATDNEWNYCGWNIDEVLVDGSAPPTYPEIAVEQPAGTGLSDGSSSIGCGSVTVGSSSPPISFTIRNTGTSDLTGLSVSKNGTNGGDYALGSLGATTLAPGASTSFSVTFSPGAAGSRAAAIHIASNDADENPFDINLTGTGVAPGALAINPAGGLASSGSYGGPFSPSSLQYTLSNPGGTAINWTAAKTANWVSLSATSGTLAAGANTTLTVSISGDAATFGVSGYNDTVTFTNTTNAGGNTTRGVALAVSPIPASLTLGNLNQTYDGSPKSVSVTTNPPGLAHSVTYNGSSTVPTDAATYAVIATVANANYTGGNSGSLVIAKISQSISFPPFAAPIGDDESPFPLGGSASSGLAVSYASSNTDVATVSGTSLTVVGPGTAVITASQPGDEHYGAAVSVQQTLTVFRTGLADAVIHEPFDDSNSTLTDNAPGRGLGGTWLGSGEIVGNSLNYGSFPASTGKTASVSNQNGHVSVGSALGNAGLLDDDKSLWFSVLVRSGGDIATNGDLGFALGTDQITAGNNLPISNSGKALGFTFNNDQLRASHWAPTLTRSGSNTGNAASANSLYLVVGKITWGATSETIEIYRPVTNLTLGSAVSTYTTPANLNQSMFDTISFGSRSATPAHLIDEIRFGASYESVIGLGASGPVDHFAISSIGSAQTVGTPITGITITAQDSSNATVTGFAGTVTFGGTGGITGTSANFVAGVLSNLSVTPTVAGGNLTFTVNDGSGHTGTTSITTIQTKFAAWAGASAFNADANGDGVENGLAWVLGAANPNINAIALLPTLSTVGGNMVFAFKRSQASINANTALTIEMGTTLGTWPGSYTVGATTAASTGGVTVAKDLPAAGTDTVTLSVAQSPDTKKFTRLKVVQTP